MELQGTDNSKIPQDLVDYKVGQGDKTCVSCINFIEPNACKVVKGIISATGVSDLYQPKEDIFATEDVEGLSNQLFGGGEL
jgi:hypothetical protein